MFSVEIESEGRKAKIELQDTEDMGLWDLLNEAVIPALLAIGWMDESIRTYIKCDD